MKKKAWRWTRARLLIREALTTEDMKPADMKETFHQTAREAAEKENWRKSELLMALSQWDLEVDAVEARLREKGELR